MPTLVQLVLQGGTQLFAKIVQRYEQPDYNLMCRYSCFEQEVDDLNQDVFLRDSDRLSGKIDSVHLDHQISGFRGMLQRIQEVLRHGR